MPKSPRSNTLNAVKSDSELCDYEENEGVLRVYSRVSVEGEERTPPTHSNTEASKMTEPRLLGEGEVERLSSFLFHTAHPP